MRLSKFSIKNYKIFKDTFEIEFSKETMTILTGRNNAGKSTVLEAINAFYKKNLKTNFISNDCFHDTKKI